MLSEALFAIKRQNLCAAKARNRLSILEALHALLIFLIARFCKNGRNTCINSVFVLLSNHKIKRKNGENYGYIRRIQKKI